MKRLSQTQYMIILVSVLGLVLTSLVGCQSWDREIRTPTTPGGDNSDLTNYAQMEDGSTVVDGQQINWYHDLEGYVLKRVNAG